MTLTADSLPLSLRGLRTLIYSAPCPCGDRPVRFSAPDAERSPLVRKSSAVIAAEVARRLGPSATLTHRDIARPVINRSSRSGQ
jgi:hypothetical protein